MFPFLTNKIYSECQQSLSYKIAHDFDERYGQNFSCSIKRVHSQNSRLTPKSSMSPWGSPVITEVNLRFLIFSTLIIYHAFNTLILIKDNINIVNKSTIENSFLKTKNIIVMAKIVSKAVSLELSKHSYGVIIYILNKYIHSKTHKYTCTVY